MLESKLDLRRVAAGAACLAEREETDVISKSRYHSLSGAKPESHTRGNDLNSHRMKKTITLVAFIGLGLCSYAQSGQTMYVVKNGTTVPVSGIENVFFDGATSGDTLYIHKNNGFPVDKVSLDNIQKISFSGENLSVATLSGNKIVYAINDVAKLMFKDANATGIHNPSAQDFDVLVRVTPAGDVVVECSVGIKSLTLFSADGKMISQQRCEGVETQCIVSLQSNAAGVYLIKIETEQGVVIKKVVKPLNK